MNQGLILITPVILVRLLTVEEFGRYREFLLYVGLLTALCAFGINNSLLYFIPSRENSARQMLRQSTLLTLLSSVTIIGVMLLLNGLLNGAVVGAFALPVAVYVLLFVNLDFWEFYWLARRRALPVFAYTTGRLVARIAVVIIAARLSHDVNVIIWSLVALEAVRVTGSLIAWRGLERQAPGDQEESCWREQLRYCLPIGTALILVVFNKSLGNLFVAKAMGAVALAHYTIGTHVQPIITVLRNSLSDALLPEMAASKQTTGAGALRLWRRATVVAMVLLVAAAVILAEFARPIVLTLFSPDYAAAVPIFQVYLLVLLREVFDFGVPLRAINRTAAIVHSNLFSIVLNLLLLTVMLPGWGLIGAVLAFAIARYAEGLYLGWRTMRAYQISLKELASWSDLGKVAIAAGLAAVVFYGSFWTDRFGLAGTALGAVAYLAVFTALLLLLRVPEITTLLTRVRNSRYPLVAKL